MKDLLKIALTLLSGAIGAAIPIAGFCFAWSWCMAQVPIGFAYAGFAKIGIAFGLIAFGLIAMGGSLTVACAIGLGLLGGSLVAHLSGLLD